MSKKGRPAPQGRHARDLKRLSDLKAGVGEFADPVRKGELKARRILPDTSQKVAPVLAPVELKEGVPFLLERIFTPEKNPEEGVHEDNVRVLLHKYQDSREVKEKMPEDAVRFHYMEENRVGNAYVVAAAEQIANGVRIDPKTWQFLHLLNLDSAQLTTMVRAAMELSQRSSSKEK